MTLPGTLYVEDDGSGDNRDACSADVESAAVLAQPMHDAVRSGESERRATRQQDRIDLRHQVLRRQCLHLARARRQSADVHRAAERSDEHGTTRRIIGKRRVTGRYARHRCDGEVHRPL